MFLLIQILQVLPVQIVVLDDINLIHSSISIFLVIMICLNRYPLLFSTNIMLCLALAAIFVEQSKLFAEEISPSPLLFVRMIMSRISTFNLFVLQSV